MKSIVLLWRRCCLAYKIAVIFKHEAKPERVAPQSLAIAQPYPKSNAVLIQYLDEFGKQMSTRKNSSALE